ncbi:MAG: hypothetical protein WAW65_04510 [Lactococcus raffinolactis]
MPLIKNTNELNDHITFIKIESVNGPDPSDETETELFSCWVKIKIGAQNIKDYKGTTFEVTMEL